MCHHDNASERPSLYRPLVQWLFPKPSKGRRTGCYCTSASAMSTPNHCSFYAANSILLHDGANKEIPHTLYQHDRCCVVDGELSSITGRGMCMLMMLYVDHVVQYAWCMYHFQGYFEYVVELCCVLCLCVLHKFLYDISFDFIILMFSLCRYNLSGSHSVDYLKRILSTYGSNAWQTIKSWSFSVSACN